MALFNLNYILKSPISKYGELGLQHTNFGKTQFSPLQNGKALEEVEKFSMELHLSYVPQAG